MNRVPYNNARKAADAYLMAPPPYELQSVTAYVLPLPASLYRLERFCHYYLNSITPKKIDFFRPAAPYVFLMAVNYGRGALDAVNLGAISQNELLFTVPLEWFRCYNGRWRFHDWAAVTPFIFVEDPWALRLGREIFGWPKSMGWFDPELDPWRLKSPAATDKPLVMRGTVSTEAERGLKPEPRILLEFERTVVSLSSPPQGLQIVSSFELLRRQLTEVFTRWYFRGPVSSDLMTLRLLLEKIGKGLGSFVPSAKLNVKNINLKQFPDIKDPSRICYQEVNSSDMEVRRVNQVGMLGLGEVVTGDLSGGYTVNIHEYSAQPFIESLGLRVSRWRDFAFPGSCPTVRVAELKPTLPFWLDLDMKYGRGEVLYWRTRYGSWHLGGAASGGGEPPRVGAGHAILESEPSDGEGYPLNTTLGGAVKTAAGPLSCDLTLRVLPLMADWEKLQGFCEGYLENDLYRFEVWGCYVYLIVRTYESVASMTGGPGERLNDEVSFSVPVKVFDKKTEKLLSLAMIYPFVFSSDENDVITLHEVGGLPAVQAAIQGGEDPWLEASGPDEASHRVYLRMKTTVISSMNLRQPTEKRDLVTVYEGDALPYNDDARWRGVASDWGREVVKDFGVKKGMKEDSPEAFQALKALAFEILANGQSINTLALKQMRHTEDPFGACYQALALGSERIESITDIREIENRIHVIVSQYPSQPIVELLGLRVKYFRQGGSSAAYLQPVRPFWMRLVMRGGQGRRLGWRAGGERWEMDDGMEGAYFNRDRDPEVGSGIVDPLPPWGELQNPKALFLKWKKKGEPCLTLGEAREAVEKIDPQMVLDSILSEEWGHWGNPRGYREASDANVKWPKPDFCFPKNTIGPRKFDPLWLGDDKDWDYFEGAWCYKEEGKKVESGAARRRRRR